MNGAKKFLIWIAAGIAGISILQSYGQAASHTFDPKGTPLHSLSYQFRELRPLFNGLAYAGYYTDKDTENSVVIAQYEQAQFVLSPTVIALNKTDYPLVIFDCSSPDKAIQKIKELGLQPIKASPQGLILAIDPKVVGK